MSMNEEIRQLTAMAQRIRLRIDNDRAVLRGVLAQKKEAERQQRCVDRAEKDLRRQLRNKQEASNG